MTSSWDIRDPRRRALTLELGEARSLVANQAMAWGSWVPSRPPAELFHGASVIGVFFVRNDGLEPSTLPELPRNCRAAYPRCEGTELSFRLCGPEDGVPHPRLHVLEAPSEAPEVEPDLLFVPAVAVDRKGRRIGRGGGFYDRYLRRARPSRTVALVREALVFEDFPASWLHDGDERIDAVLTESAFHEIEDLRRS